MGDLGSIIFIKEGKVDKIKVRVFIGCGCEEWGRGRENKSCVNNIYLGGLINWCL